MVLRVSDILSATAARARQGETMNEIIVGYLRVLLSAPPMAALVVIVLGWGL